jgi:hypothetical protein
MINILMLPFQSQLMQAPGLFPETRFFFGVAGYGSGKSRAFSMILLYIAKQLSGKKDRNGHRPRGILAGATLGHLQKTTLGYIIEDLDNSKTPYVHDKKNNVLHVGGIDVMLVAMSVPENIRGEDAYFILADEVDDIGKVTGSDDTTFEAVRALNERCRQVVPGERPPYMIMASTSQGQKGLYRIYTSFKKSSTGFVLIRGRTVDNWYLDPTYEQSLRKIYSPHEYRVYAEGEFLALASGRVFGDFDWGRNYVEYDMDTDIPSGETVYTSFDLNTGYNRGCAFRLVNGVLYAVKAYDFSDLRDAPKVLRYDFPHNRIFFIPDTTAKDIIATFIKELHRYNIHYISRSKNPLVEDSVFLVNKLLYTSRFLVCPMAKDLAEALSLEMRDKDGNIPKGKGPASPVHITDSARWVAYFLALTNNELNDIRNVTIARHEAIRETIEERQELSSGYVDMTPAAV